MTTTILANVTQNMEEMKMAEKTIPYEKFDSGIKQGIEITENLLKDSETLLKKKRYSSSVSLAILAYEEISKQNILRLAKKLGISLPWKIWLELSYGGKAHHVKLSSMMTERKLNLEKKTSPRVESYLNKINKEFGFPELADNRAAQIEAEFLEQVLPKLNAVKKDCFYLDYDLKNNDWIHFENRFDEKTKEAIALFVITLTKRITAFQKFLRDIPAKPFEKYTKAEMKQAKKSKSRKELQKILKNTGNKRFQYLHDVAIIAIDSYPEVKKKK